MYRKKLVKQIIGLLGICFLTGFYCACDNGFQNPGQAGKDGKVHPNQAAVSIVITETRTRTVFPDVSDSDIAAYKLFGGYGGSPVPGGEETELAELAVREPTVFIEPGTWNFTLNAYNSAGVLILQGTVQNKTINLSGTNEVNFSLSTVNSGAGDVRITINFPDTAGITRITASGDIEQEEFSVDAGDGEFIYAKTGLDAGDYFISFKLYREDELRTVFSEEVLVRSNLTSAKTITLVGNDLKPESSVVTQYTVTFDSQGGSDVNPITADSGSAINKPADPTKTGYTFINWYKEETLITLWNFATDTVTADITLYAKWLEAYTVIFDSQGGSPVNPITADSGSAIDKPVDPTKDGYTFINWYKEETLITLWNFATDTVTGDITLYAKWLEAYTVTFDSQGGSPVNPITAESGSAINKPVDPTRAGYTFINWYKEEAYITLWNFATDTVTGDITLYAKWNPQYTVTFDSQGGSDVNPITADSGNAINKPVDPTKTGYTFNDWYKEETCITPWNFATDTVTGDITLYASWTPNQYTVTFNSYGGTAVSPITGVNYGSTVTRPGNPTSGYGIFENWYSDAGRTALFNFDTPITDNTTLHAKWTAAYNLGATGPGGGKVFYRSETGFTMTDNNEVCHYLEAAPNDVGELVWLPAIPGGANTYINNTSEAIGAGRKNTALILAYAASAPAAKACNDYTNNGKTDWFLPSSNELMQLYNNWTHADNLQDSWSNGYYYWSSHTYSFEFTDNTLYHLVTCIGFRMGDTQGWRGSYNDVHVRPIRAF